MAFDLDNGYQPRSFAEILEAYVTVVNSQFGTAYDSTTIVGTEFYRLGYSAIQLIMQSEAETAEITAFLTDYVRTVNENINLPKSSQDGFISGLLAELELNSTMKPLGVGEGGNMFLVVDVDDEADDYATTKQQIINRMALWLTAGLEYNGTEEGDYTHLNGQVFSYKYALPTPVDMLVRITVTVSENAKTPILNENQVREIFNTNFAALYKIGLDFEPEKYLEIARDLPFASDILLEYSEDAGSTWDDQPRAMAYNEKINITAPATVSIV